MSRRQLIIAATLCAALAVSGLIAADSKKAPKLTADDYVEIQQLYSDYAYALDQNQGESFAGTFVDDGEFTGARRPGQPPRAPTKGKEALITMGKGGGGGASRHFITNLRITRTPEGAKASCYFLQFSVKTTPAVLTLNALYDDTLVKTPQGWKFKVRHVYREDDDTSPFRPVVQETK